MIHQARWTRPGCWILCGFALYSVLATSGCHCISKASHAVPASRLDPTLFGVPKEQQVPILFSALGQPAPKEHIVGPGDTLAVFVFGVLPFNTDEPTPVLQQQQSVQQRYYPPHGAIVGPTTGLPMTVKEDGTLEMPFVGRVDVAGLSLTEITEKFKSIYTEEEIFQPGRERVSVSLIIPRVKRVLVLRQDTPATPVALTPPGVVDQVHRGSGEVIDLPVYENDVLHALTATGGLPGTDAVREVWVMRNCVLPNGKPAADRMNSLMANLEAGVDCGPAAVRIPLTSLPHEPLQFSPGDVVLNEGDVVYVPQRLEYFYTGGLLGGAKIPLPADEDLDILEAIALATGSTGGPLGAQGAILAAGRPGWFIKPTRVVILRKLPDGSQLPVRVDLARAVEDQKERIIIQPDDIVMLHFKPTEGTVNAILNFFNINAVTSLDGN